MNLAETISRVAVASPHEWKIRSRQLAFSRMSELLTRGGRAVFVRDGHLRSLGMCAEELPCWAQERRSCWLPDENRKRRIQDYFKVHPTAASQLIERADRIRRDEMFVLGHGAIPFRGEDKWHRDHILGIVSPRRFYGRIQYLDCREVGDSKHVWEPNRFAWAYWLGTAYVITSEIGYAEKFSELTVDWFDKNPYPIGINYCSALEMALRAYAWVWALELFRDSPTPDREVFARLVQGIWTSCRHLENNLSYYFAPNTHLLGEAFALFACGASIPEFRESRRWRKLGAEILAQEAGKQFHRDGTHRELSTCYHLYATDFYLHAALIARQTGFALPPVVETLGRKAAERLGELVTADFTLPHLNDCDDGRLDWFSVNPLDAKPSLLAARTLWPDVEFPSEPSDGNGYHLWMGAVGPDLEEEKLTPETRCELPQVASLNASSEHTQFDSGLVAYRNSRGDFVLFRSGPFGYMDCGHSHDGPTSLILHLAGQPVIVDSGVGAYTQSSEIRNRFRAPFGKNVLTLDGCEPSASDGWFRWKRKTHATLSYVHHKTSGLQCAGFHHGFQPALGFAARVSRRVEFDDGVALIVDEWDAAQPVAPRLAWTLHPGLLAEWETCSAPTVPAYWRGTLRDGSGSRYHFLICQLAANAQVNAGKSAPCRGEDEERDGGDSAPSRLPDLGESRLSVVSGPYSPAYGVLQETQYMVIDFNKSKAGCALTAFSRRGELRLSMGSAGQIIVKTRQGTLAIGENPAGQLVL